MSVIKNEWNFAPLSEEELAAWREIPTAILSDEMNRTGTADSGLRPIGTVSTPVVGLAATVRAMAADNLALHHAVAVAPAGCVLMVDAGGYMRNAVWGGIMQRSAELRGVAAVVVDGCIRDSAELKVSSVPCYARGIVPAGPSKGWGGELNGTVSVGGCAVSPGDLIVCDEDGVAVIPPERRQGLIEACKTRIAAEQDTMRRLEAGETTVGIFGL